MLHWIQQFFLYEYKVIYPKNSVDFISREEQPIASEIADKGVTPRFFIIAVAGILIVCVIVVLCVARKRKSKSRQ